MEATKVFRRNQILEGILPPPQYLICVLMKWKLPAYMLEFMISGHPLRIKTR